MGVRIIGLIVVVAVLGAALYSSQLTTEPLKVSGFVEAHEVRVGSRVGGRVESVKVKEGATVAASDVLVTLEAYDLKERRAAAAAELDQRKSALAKLEAGHRAEDIEQARAARDRLAALVSKLKAGPRAQEINAAQSQVEAADARLEFANLTLKRAQTLMEKRAVNQEDLDRAVASVKIETATLNARRQELELLQAGTRGEEIAEAEAQLAGADAALSELVNGFRKEDIDEARAAVAAADAALAAIDRQMQELTVRAPTAGVVEAVDLEPGDLIGPNQPALSMLDVQELWVRAYVPENRLNLKVGQTVSVTVDSYPGRRFKAHVSYVATQAEFTPRNVQTPEERSKQVFRIKATLDEGGDVLRPGMAADVWLEAAE